MPSLPPDPNALRTPEAMTDSPPVISPPVMDREMTIAPPITDPEMTVNPKNLPDNPGTEPPVFPR